MKVEPHACHLMKSGEIIASYRFDEKRPLTDAALSKINYIHFVYRHGNDLYWKLGHKSFRQLFESRTIPGQEIPHGIMPTSIAGFPIANAK